MGIKLRRLTSEEKEKIVSLYNEGKMDTEIGKILNISDSTVFYWRKKLGLKTKFTYDKISKIDNNKFEELFNKGFSDYKIAKELNMSSDGVYSHRMKYGYYRKKDLRFNDPIKLTSFQKQVLLGTLLGDASLRLPNDSTNPAITCAHCIAQKEYCEYKTEIFKSLKATCNYHKRHSPDKRNGNIYEDYTMFIPANPAIKDWYYSFYKKGKKVIPFDLFKYFTEASLAFMFMDDGTKIGNSYSIATNCFDIEELKKFQDFLYKKFCIETTIWKNHGLYIKINSRNLFTKLISPYICKCMKYKLHIVS